MSGTAFGGEITRVTTTQELPLGFEVTVPNGDSGLQTWIYIQAEDALQAGEVVMKKDGVATFATCKTAAANTLVIRLVGVAQHVIAAASYGFVLRRGVGEVGASDTGNDQANDPLVVAGSDGFAHPYNNSTAAEYGCVFAISSENAGTSAGDLMTCTIFCG